MVKTLDGGFGFQAKSRLTGRHYLETRWIKPYLGCQEESQVCFLKTEGCEDPEGVLPGSTSQTLEISDNQGSSETAEDPGGALRHPSWAESRRPLRLNMSRSNPFDARLAQTLPVGARLKFFLPVWASKCQDPWVLSTIQWGHFWSFSHPPPQNSFTRTEIPSSPLKAQALRQFVSSLQLQGAAVPVPLAEHFAGFYSTLFLVPKRTGGWRPVIDLKRLNRHIHPESFKMESLQMIIQAVQPTDWMISIDLQDAYLHVPILPAFQKYLRFAVGWIHLQFQALPFGLCTSPRVFTKILISALVPLRERGLRIYHYLDDILLLASSPGQLVYHRDILLQSLRELGWLINSGKSQLAPTQRMIYLGAMFDTREGTVSLPSLKMRIIIQKMLKTIASRYLTASQCLSLIGTMSACIPMIPWAHWHLRYFQMGFLAQWKKQRLSQTILLTGAMRRSLHWWTLPENLSKPRHLGSLFWITVMSDASGQGWGAHCGETRIQGRWSCSTQGVVSNILEMRATFLALTSLASQIRGQRVLLRLDNRAAVAYLQRQGGTRSTSLLREVEPIMLWAKKNVLDLRAMYLPGRLNTEADTLSRKFLDNNEWALHPQVFHQIANLWDPPQVDLFATPGNAKLTRFVSRLPYTQAEEVDALSCPWRFTTAYAFPPRPLIFKFLLRLLRETVQVLAVLPYWPKRPWFPLAMRLSVSSPIRIHPFPQLLTQGSLVHPDPQKLNLRIWRLRGEGLSP